MAITALLYDNWPAISVLLGGLIAIQYAKRISNFRERKRLILRTVPRAPLHNRILGHLPSFGNPDPLSDFIKWGKELGPIFMFQGLFGNYQLVVADPRIVHYIATKNRDNYKLPGWFGGRVVQFLGNGMIAVEGEHHKRQRRQLTGVFAQANINNYADTFYTAGMKLMTKWKAAVGDNKEKEVVVAEDVARSMLDVIGAAGFGADLKAFENPESEVNTCFNEANEGMSPNSSFGRALLFMPWLDVLPTAHKARFQYACKIIFGFTDDLIKERREALKGESGKKDLMSQMLKFEDQMPLENEMRYQMANFLIAGYETTTLTLSYILYLLGRHPKVQDKLRAELEDLMPNKDSLPPLEKIATDSNGVSYLSAVIKEALRLHPPLGLIPPKTAINDDSIELDGVTHHIPAGTEIIICPNVMHRLPQYWGDDADEFRPERWIENNDETNFVPFGHGKRMCVGWRFAMLELKIITALVVRNLQLAISKEYVEETGGTDREPTFVSKDMALTLLPKPALRLLISEVQ